MKEEEQTQSENEELDFDSLRFYLPPAISEDAPYLKNMLFRYLESEFPHEHGKTVVHHIPKVFSKRGETQGSLAEELVFERLKSLASLEIPDLWINFFHSASYGGYSNRNRRLGKLVIREHDFVVFVKHHGKYFVLLLEVKSTNDNSTVKTDLEVTADSKVIKNNKRSAQHQLRDHLEILRNYLEHDVGEEIQCYIMWPFLGQYTRDPKQQVMKRWTEDKNLHVFEDVISDQKTFNVWFQNEVIAQSGCTAGTFVHLLTRYIVLSCGVFMDEIDKDMLALLTLQQLDVLKNTICQKGGALVVHGIAGTGKTLLVIKKLQSLYENGELNAQNRALYICYWPGIRCEVLNKLKLMGIEDYVDTARFYVTSTDFLKRKTCKYKHIFMDEAEAIILSFQAEIVQNTFYRIYKAYHDGNCPRESNCPLTGLEVFKRHSVSELIRLHVELKVAWGELWFMVDTNQALMFLPTHSPDILKTPHVVLNKLIRSTNQISSFFSTVAKQIIKQEQLNFPKYEREPPIFWVPRKDNISQSVSEVIVDLCSTKGVKPCDICVIPFLQNELLSIEAINSHISQKFADKAFRIEGVRDVEAFLTDKHRYEFLIAWALRVKGLEFKVVIMAIDEDQFDKDDPDDRRKIYVISSRCTCMLIVICDDDIKKDTGLNRLAENYRFHIKFEYNND